MVNDTDPGFVHLTGQAFREAGSLLALSRSPLAAGALIAAGLVLDDLAPTEDERGLALRLALQWATEQLAPEASDYPFGLARPVEDPTWSDPRWWRYSLLRHRYLEPLRADEAAEGGTVVQRLLARTGIPSTDLYYEEKGRALRMAARWLERQQNERIGDERLQQLALAAALEPLRDERAAVELLSMAAVFGRVFAREALLEMAADEGLSGADAALNLLVQNRCLLAGDGGAGLWLSPALRAWVLERQAPDRLVRRRQSAAHSAQRAGRPLDAARHWIESNHPLRAAELLLGMGEAEIFEAEREALPLLRALAQPRSQRSLAPAQARGLALRRAELLRRTNEPDDAIRACGEALRLSESLVEEGEVYRRLGSLYEELEPEQALVLYQKALERLPADHRETPVLLKDRAWIFLLQGQWAAAESDLLRALEWQGLTSDGPGDNAANSAADPEAMALRADILEGLSGLFRGVGNHARAVECAREAIASREQAGDPHRLGKSMINLGILYRVMGDYENAITSYREAEALHMRLGSFGPAATALLNIGTAWHFAERLPEAEAAYRRCLALADEAGLSLMEVRARASLAEALAEQGRVEEALGHWQEGRSLSLEAGFAEEIDYLQELLTRYPVLEEALQAQDLHLQEVQAQEVWPAEGAAGEAHGPDGTGEDEGRGTWASGEPAPPLDADEAAALGEARRSGRVTAATFMRVAQVSKATATRKLARLAEAGLLQRHGSGRATCYLPPARKSHTAVGPRLDSAALQARLTALTPRFSTSHGVERFEVRALFRRQEPDEAQQGGVLGAAQETLDGGMRFDVFVVFRRPPDLAGFLEIESALRDATRTNLNLVL